MTGHHPIQLGNCIRSKAFTYSVSAFLVEDWLRHGVDWFLQIHIGCHVKTYTVESRNDEDQICAFSQTPHNFIRRWLHIVPSTYRKRINKECDGFIYDLGSFLDKSFSSIKKKSLENYCVFRLTSSKMNDHTFLRKSFNKSRAEGGRRRTRTYVGKNLNDFLGWVLPCNIWTYQPSLVTGIVRFLGSLSKLYHCGVVSMPKSPTKSVCLPFELLKTEKVF